MNKKETIALYLRISEEDKRKQEGRNSRSIEGQRMLLTEYVRQHDGLRGRRMEEFIDDGYSGANFDRPGVRALFSGAKEGRIGCILVKDLSRFGRNYLEVGRYLEQIFPRLGIRFISINDHFDSFEGMGAAGSIEVGFRNILYAAYSAELSRKVRSVRRMKAGQGKFVTARPPYGYQKDISRRDRLLPRPQTAEVVRRIFSLYLEGMSQSAIAGLLNAEGIPSPAALDRKEGEGALKGWMPAAVSRILSDARYTGTAIYGKSRPVSIGSKKSEALPQEAWIRVPGAHEAIISQETFAAAAALRQMRRRR